MKKLLCTLLALPVMLSYGQTCNKLNHNCSNTVNLNTSGVISNSGGIYACAPGDNVLYTTSTNAYIATDDIQIAEGNAVTLHFEAKKNSTYFGTCEVWVHVGGWCNFTVYTTPFDDNGWVQIGTFSPNTTCSNFGPFTVPSDVIGGQQISYCIVPKNSSSSNWVAIDDICVSEISGAAVPTTMYEDFGTSSSGWYPNAGVDDIPYHTYKNASSAYTLLSFGVDGGSDKAAYFYTGFDFCSSVSGVGIITKEVNTSGYSNGEIRLQFKSKYPCSGANGYTFDESYQNYSPEVFVMTGADNGSNTWNALPVNYYFADYTWRVASYDISAYKNANVRFKVERGGFCGTAMEAVDNIKILDRDCSISLLSCGIIAGETAPLQNTDYPYIVSAVTGATYYKWYVRHDGNLYDTAPYIVSGQGTLNPTINFQTLPASGVRVLCIPFDVDPASNPDACYAEIGILGVTVSAAVPLVFDNVDSTHVSCNGIDDGTINLTVSGGVPAYTYAWVPNVSSTNFAVGLAPGNYQITVTDINLDQIVENILITEPPLLAGNVPAFLSMCENDSVQIIAGGTGGTPPYTYNWTPTTNISDPNIPNPWVYPPPPSEIYSLTVIDANGCTSIENCNVAVITAPIPSMTATPLSGCGPLVVTFTNTTVAATVSCDLQLGDGGNLSNCTLGANTYFTEGSYDLVFTVVDGNGCVGTTMFGSYITVDPPALGDFTYGTYCANDTDPLPSYVGGGVAGTFSSTAGLIIDSGTGLVDLSASTPGTYTITNDVTLGGCNDSFSDDITINGLPNASISGSATVCSNDPLPDITIDITAGAANWDITYNFDSSPVVVNAGSTPHIISSAAVGTYDLLSITDANGCTNTLTGQVVIDTLQAPTIDLGPDFTFCDDFVTIDAGAGMDSYLWSTSETNQTINVSITDDYWVTVELNGCFATDTVHATRLDCSGIVEFGGQTVSVYPNPANDIVVIKDFPANTNLSIVSAKGEVVYSSMVQGTQTSIDVSAFESGIYLIRLSNDSESKTIRLVKN